MNVKKDHIHMIIFIPPKLSISEVMGMLKGKNGDQNFSRSQKETLLRKPFFKACGYCISTIGLDETKIRKYIKY